MGVTIAGNDPRLLLQCFIRDHQPTLNIVWDLDASVAPLLKLLGEDRCSKLYRTGKCYLSPFSLFYITGKVFSVKPVFKRPRSSLYDIRPYYPESYYSPSLAHLVGKGEELLEALRLMNLYPRKLTSPIAIWEQCVMNHLNLPTAWNMPREAAEFAWHCGGKLWTEAYKVGYFEEAYDYDIEASFPSIAGQLVDIRHCKWVESNNYIKEALYGYCRCIVTIFDRVKVSPIIYTDVEGNLSTPTGTWQTYLTKGEIDFIEKYKIGKVRILEGWWATARREIRPLAIVMNRLLAYKFHENELVRYLAKRMSVGVYGKFGEERGDRFGRHFNSCWFAEISTQVRLEVAEFIYKNKLEDNLIHIGVDGVLLDKEIKL
jgi:hypothetical protein